MEKVPLPIVVGTSTYGEYLAYSLIAYAQTNESFCHWLVNTILEKQITPYKVYVSNPEVNILLPRDESMAVRRAQWLFEKHTNETNPALQVLANWARDREREEPKAFVLGLMYGVVNYGVWGHPTKKNQPVDIIVKSNVLKDANKKELSQMCVSLTNEIVHKGLLDVGGNANKLEPELSDWLFGEKNIVLHRGDNKTVELIERKLNELKAPYAKRTDKNGTTYLALGPSIYLQEFKEADTLEQVD